MKSTKHDATEAKRILTGMIVDPVVLARVAERWHTDGLFDVRWANTVAAWCVDYYRRYRRAPNGDIEGLFESWAATANEDEVKLVDLFLDTLNEDYEALAQASNSEYVIDTAGDYFNGVALAKLGDTLKGHVDRGDIAAATAAVGKWGRVELGAGAGIDVFNDEAAVRAAFTSKADPLITYPGPIGEFFSDQFGRDEFVAITGATGRGKTWWLMEFAWMGVRSKRKVAFFAVGDMSQDQMMRRFLCRSAGWPVKPPKGQRGWPVEVRYPVALTRAPDDIYATVEHEIRRFDGPLNFEKAWEANQKRMRRKKETMLRLSTHPTASISVDGVANILDGWEREGWVPDIVVVDYADILAAPPGYTPGDREAINATWMRLRGLSQRRHCCVITGTQADANSYTAATIRRGNFSDDRRKNDHVTGMLGINQTDPEADMGVMRLNWTKRREEEYNESHCVHVAGCLNVGKPVILSTW